MLNELNCGWMNYKIFEVATREVATRAVEITSSSIISNRRIIKSLDIYTVLFFKLSDFLFHDSSFGNTV